jgi:hypothetical protein
MTIVSYTLDNNGIASTSEGGIISGQWWSQSPVDGIGVFYQARATLINAQIEEDTQSISGIFGQWVSLSETKTWSIDKGLKNTGAILFLIEIRSISSPEISGRAEITLGVFINNILGTYSWSLDIPKSHYYSLSVNDTFTVTNPVALPIGSVVTFKYFTSAAPGPDQPLIQSGVAASNEFFIRVGALSNSITFKNCTLKIDGISVSDQDVVFAESEFYVIEATITASTNIEFLGFDGVSSWANQNGVGELTVNNLSTVLFWPLDDISTSLQVEQNFGGNDIVISSYSGSLWRDKAFQENQSPSGIRAILAPAGNVQTGTVNTQSPTLRSDGLGSSVNYSLSSYQLYNRQIPYQNGFTIESLVKIDVKSIAFPASQGRAGHCVQALNNAGPNTLWCMRFDNFSNSAVTDVFPVFSILKRDTIYGNSDNYPANMLDEVRGTDPLILGRNYHLLATIRPSDNTIEFWVDGISLGTGSIPTTWYDANGDPEKNILDGTFPTFLNVGIGYLDGLWRNGDTTNQNVNVHLLEADQAFATNQFLLNNPDN